MLHVKQLPSGYWHIRGHGPCNWTQPPSWPCSEDQIRSSAFPQASDAFLRECVAAADAMLRARTPQPGQEPAP